MSDRKLIRRYLTPKIRQQIRFRPSEKQLAEYLRRKIRSEVGGEFHGTLVSGVIAAKPEIFPKPKLSKVKIPKVYGE